MKRAASILLITGIILIVFQLVGYLGTAIPEKPTHDFQQQAAKNVWYYTGYNIFLMAGMILLIISFYLRRKHNKRKLQIMIDSIGKDEK